MDNQNQALAEKLRRALVPAAMILLLALLLARATRPTAAGQQVGEESSKQTITGANLAGDVNLSINGNQPLFQSPQPTPTTTRTPIPATPTNTPIPATPTNTPIPATPTNTPIPATPTNTPIPATPTNTPIPATPTNTPIPATPTNTPIPATPTNTPIPPTPTPTPLPPLTVGELTAVYPPTGIVEKDVEISFSVVFTDPAYSDHSAQWYWGDGTVEEPISVDNSPAENSHVYREPGIYTVSVTISNPDGDSASSTYESVVVYDPGDGFVTGGGWINSPAGAYRHDPSLTGKATFAFVSKYTKGKATPTGHTEFKFKAAGFEFSSAHYYWLVVKGNEEALFSGSGSINGQIATNGDPYKFTVWADDDDPDTFRIRIWWEDVDATENVIYDNGVQQPIGGGSIVIHSGRGK